MSASTAMIVARRPTTRSAVSNGSRILDGVDGRSIGARRFKDLIESFARDLGGMNSLSEVEQSLIRQAASVTMRAEQLQAAIVRGETVDPDELIRLTNTVRRCLTAIQTRVQSNAPSNDYLANLEQEHQCNG